MDRRDFFRAAGAGSAALLLPDAISNALADTTGNNPWRVYEVTTRVEVLKPAGLTRAWIPLPLAHDSDYQKSLGNSWDAGTGRAAYWQDHQPVREAATVAGHAVRQLYLDCGAVEVAVELSSKAPRQVTVTMSKPARVLDPVAVRADASTDGLDQVGFSDRKKNGFGYFMGPEQINDRQATRMTDLFRMVPSLRIVPSGSDYVVESARDAIEAAV